MQTLSLSRSGYYSVDAFLEKSEQMDLGKYLIACQLKKCEDIDKLFYPHEPGWYHTLFSALIGEHEIDYSENDLSIITFNYDRSLEAYLHNAFQNRFDLNSEDAWAKVVKIPIVHVHGILGEYPAIEYKNTSTVEELVNISEEIKIIHEIKDSDEEFCNIGFETANSFLKQSERIVFLGFGFHLDNVRRFNFFSPDTLKCLEIYTTSTGLTGFEYKNLLEKLKEYGLKDSLGPHHGQACDGLFRNYLIL